MTVREMLARMGADELAEWQAFYSLDPWGEQRADLRQAMLLALIVNALRSSQDKIRSLRDFMLFPDDQIEREQPVEEQRTVMRKIQQAITKLGHRHGRR